MQQIFAAAQQAMSAQQELANTEVTGTAGGGVVRAVVSGVGQLIDLQIDPSAIDPTDPAETAATVAERRGAAEKGRGQGWARSWGEEESKREKPQEGEPSILFKGCRWFDHVLSDFLSS